MFWWFLVGHMLLSGTGRSNNIRPPSCIYEVQTATEVIVAKVIGYSIFGFAVSTLVLALFMLFLDVCKPRFVSQNFLYSASRSNTDNYMWDMLFASSLLILIIGYLLWQSFW